MLPVKEKKYLRNRNVTSHVFAETTHVVVPPHRFASVVTLLTQFYIPSFIEIRSGVLEPRGRCRFPLLWLLALTTACTVIRQSYIGRKLRPRFYAPFLRYRRYINHLLTYLLTIPHAAGDQPTACSVALVVIANIPFSGAQSADIVYDEVKHCGATWRIR